MRKYSQVTAMLAITRASLKSIFRSPSAVIFSLAFPFVFILAFVFIGGNQAGSAVKIAIDAKCDTANTLFDSIKNSKQIKIVHFESDKELTESLEKGKIAGVFKITKRATEVPAYVYTISTTTASNEKLHQFLSLVDDIANKISDEKYVNRPIYAVADFNYNRDVKKIREHKIIDFILPGMLGFSLLSSGVFGVAFVFFSLRNMLVLKRFFATPISRTYIILGEGLARVIFHMLTAIVIILAGRFVFGFTLVHGLQTLLQMLVLSFIGLVVFMGLGFIVSGIARNESTIPPIANLLTLPQFILCGTFYPIDELPTFLQVLAKALPLSSLNTAMRAVAFEGQNLWDVKGEIGILLLWGVIVYAVAVKVFKWE
jgi:ABC-2 type transport system permease protein